MTAKELRDKKTDCRKVYLLIKAKTYLKAAGEMEAVELVQKSIKSINVGEAFVTWSSLFGQYNQANDYEFDMCCAPCWENVLNWAIKYEKVDV